MHPTYQNQRHEAEQLDIFLGPKSNSTMQEVTQENVPVHVEYTHHHILLSPYHELTIFWGEELTKCCSMGIFQVLSNDQHLSVSIFLVYGRIK